MITSVRSANIHEGKGKEATAWAKATAEYLNDTFNTNISVLANIGGPLLQLHWVNTHESLGALEVLREKMDADAGFQERVEAAAGLFVGSSLVDSLYRTV